MNEGILLTGGSDWYVTDLDPLKGIYAATHMNNPKESLTMEEAITIYTENAAKLSFDEKRLGQIKEGFQADFTCLSKNLFTEDSFNNKNINFTIKNGEIIYSPL